MSASTQRTTARIARAVVATVVATAAVLTGASAPASAATLGMALSIGYGPSGSGGTIIGTVSPSAAVPVPFAPGTTPVVQFQYVGSAGGGCGASARTDVLIAGTGTVSTAGVLTVSPGRVKRITSSKIVFRVPDGQGDATNPSGLVLAGTQTQAKWNVCVYDTASTTSSTLIASALYTVVIRPTITSISPTISPAGGGQVITVVGNGFTPVSATAISGSIGGVALTAVKIASNGQSFTAVTGPRAPEDGLELLVNTPGGTVSSLDPDNDPNTFNPISFSYANGITVSPTTAASATQVTLDIRGAGFSQPTFDTSSIPTSNHAHVVLVQGAYDSSANRGVAECVVDMVISDTELVCTMDLNQQLSRTTSVVTGNQVADGAYIVTLIQDGTVGSVNANPSIITSSSAFVVAPY